MSIPFNELQKLTPSTIIELCELDMSPYGQGILRFHPGTNALRQSVIWAGNEYVPFPLEMTGFEMNGHQQLPTPTLRLANLRGAITSYILSYNDLVGVKFTRRRTLLKYLDAVNFPNGSNPTADPTQEFPADIYKIEQKTKENKVLVEFSLSTAIDVDGVQIPRRQVIANVCPWKYRGDGCGYAGTAMYDENDNPTLDPKQDKCGKRLASCKVHFTKANVASTFLPFGGFPSAILNLPQGNG